MSEYRYGSGIIRPPETLDQMWSETCRMMADIVEQRGDDHSNESGQRIDVSWDGIDDMALSRFDLMRFSKPKRTDFQYHLKIMSFMTAAEERRYRLKPETTPSIEVFDENSQKYVPSAEYFNDTKDEDELTGNICRYLSMAALSLCSREDHRAFETIVVTTALAEWRELDLSRDGSDEKRNELQNRHTAWRIDTAHMAEIARRASRDNNESATENEIQ